MTRNFLNISDIKKNDLKKILRRGIFLKRNRTTRKKIKSLDNVNLAMIFEKPSTRTRVSFELAIKELGGRSVILDSTNMHISRGESIADTARVLSRYCQIMMIRTKNHNKLLEYHINSNLPVINGLSDFSHPCQVLADVMTFEEKKGNIKDKKISWLGDINNVLYSWAEAAILFEFELKIACPRIIKVTKNLKKLLDENPDKLILTNDPLEAALDADCIVTDTWFSMGNKRTIKKANFFKPYQVNSKVMKVAKKTCVFMHCLPASRGSEVTTDVIDNTNISLVWDEAENRLHIQKAILEWCLKKI
tara:strand:+ start:723 stop:1637 length:915 start_codon:yes stop_codon:yes gene_type:complete